MGASNNNLSCPAASKVKCRLKTCKRLDDLLRQYCRMFEFEHGGQVLPRLRADGNTVQTKSMAISYACCLATAKAQCRECIVRQPQ